MKILDKYILKSFLTPFLATFLVVLFILVMQWLWLTFESIAGKGISLFIILKFLYYTILIMVPQALPIGVLISSIMALGNLGENYEFSAAKSAGVSLKRLIRPIFYLTIFLSIINFLFLNNVFPYAMLKQRNLYSNIKKSKPAMALTPGSFNSDLPGFQIKFSEKYGENEDLLKEVLIYDLSGKKGNRKVISAARGMLRSEEGSKYMTLTLYDGNYYEEHIKPSSSYNEIRKMPASSATFDEYEFNIDISSLDNDFDKDEFKNSPAMFSLSQLKDTIPILKKKYDETLNLRAKNIAFNFFYKGLHALPDSLKNKNITPKILENFIIPDQLSIITSSISKAQRSLGNIDNNINHLKYIRKVLNFFDTEYYYRISFSLSSILLFFIGASLGSIIRKGGFGFPMILAIGVYVLYFFSSTFGKNLAEESTITSFLGSWISVFIMLPLGIILTRRATNDKGLFNIDNITQPIINFIKKIAPKKTEKI